MNNKHKKEPYESQDCYVQLPANLFASAFCITRCNPSELRAIAAYACNPQRYKAQIKAQHARWRAKRALATVQALDALDLGLYDGLSLSDVVQIKLNELENAK